MGYRSYFWAALELTLSSSSDIMVGALMCVYVYNVQSTLVISKSKGPSETLPDIRTSTYQICRTEKNTNRTTEFHKRTCNLTPLDRNVC